MTIRSQSRAGVDLANVKMSMNPFCEIAVEEAIRLREKNLAKEVVAVTVGPKAAAETLRTALAMGADRAIHIETDLRTDQELQPLAVAKLFKFLTAKVRRSPCQRATVACVLCTATFAGDTRSLGVGEAVN